jgi:hypothetical protein
MYARKYGEDHSAPGSLESMGYRVDGYWTEVQHGSKRYRVPRLVIGLLPTSRIEATAAAPIHPADEEPSGLEINCTILNELRRAADGSFYPVSRLRVTLKPRKDVSLNLAQSAR